MDSDDSPPTSPRKGSTSPRKGSQAEHSLLGAEPKRKSKNKRGSKGGGGGLKTIKEKLPCMEQDEFSDVTIVVGLFLDQDWVRLG